MAKTLIFLVILALLSGLNGCIPDGGTITTTTNETGNEGTFEGLSAETEKQMKRDFFRTYLYSTPTEENWRAYVVMGTYLYPPSTTVDEVQIYYYFGNYNGYEVAAFLTGPFDVQIGGGLIHRYSSLFSEVTYHDYTIDEPYYDRMHFQFPQPAAMLAWKPVENSENGHFYTMQEAYDLDLLTRNDIQSMHDLYYDMGLFEDLDEETKTRITVWVWINYYRESIEDIEDLSEERKSQLVFNFWNSPYGYFYLGTYHDYVIFSDYGGWDAITCIQVYDFVFYYGTSSLIYAWHKGNGCAYVMAGYPEYKEIDYKDFLTAEDAKRMWERHIMY